MTGKEVHNKKTYRIVAWLSILALLPLLSSCHKDSGEGKKAVETSEKSQIKIGDYTWEGFTGVSFDYPITVLLLKEPHQLQVVLFKEVEGQKINLEDDDVQTIIRSITIK